MTSVMAGCDTAIVAIACAWAGSEAAVMAIASAFQVVKQLSQL